MPTRYALDVELKSIVTADVVSGSNPTARQNSRKEVKKILEDKRAPRVTSPPPPRPVRLVRVRVRTSAHRESRPRGPGPARPAGLYGAR